MKAHMDAARTRLGELGALAARTEAAERRILELAEQRLEDVQAAITRARPGIEIAPPAAQDRYLSLVSERAQLSAVIARAKSALNL